MNLIRYGIITVSAGISIGGALWYTRGNAVSGEDLAECVAAVTERELAGYGGTNDYAFTSNTVQSGVSWTPLYVTVLSGARTMALEQPYEDTWWVTGDVPADGEDATLYTNAPARFVSLDTRIPHAGVNFYDGITPTNFPVSDYLWGHCNTNAQGAYTVDASPWSDGNWWTATGLGTNVYRYGCEIAGSSTVTTSYNYRITASTAPQWTVGTVFYPTGDYTTNYSSYTDVPVKGYGELRWYDLPTDNIWFLGTPLVRVYFFGYYNWPEIGTLTTSGSGNTVTLEKLTVLTTNLWNIRLNKAVTTNNLNEARNVLTNLFRTVRFGWSATDIEATNEIRKARITEFTSDDGTWPQTFGSAQGYTEFYRQYTNGVQTWIGPVATNTAMQVSASLAWRDYVPYAHFEGPYGGVPPSNPRTASMNSQDIFRFSAYGGCQIPWYPSDYAFANTYVARYRVYLLVKDEDNTANRHWYRVCDETSPTNRPLWNVDSAALGDTIGGWETDWLTEDDFITIYGDGSGNGLMWLVGSGYNGTFDLDGELGSALTIEGYAVVTDWNWRHFGATPFVPSNNVPAWATP